MLHGYALLAACLRLRGLTKLALIFVSSFILFACGGSDNKTPPDASFTQSADAGTVPVRMMSVSINASINKRDDKSIYPEGNAYSAAGKKKRCEQFFSQCCVESALHA